MTDEPIQGEEYCYKGNNYIIIVNNAILKGTQKSDDEMVVYFDIKNPHQLYIRSKKDFINKMKKI